MSIAVSAVVHPSRLLSLFTIGMCVLVTAIAAAFGFGLLGWELAPLARFVLLTSCGFIALFGFYHGSAPRKTIHIDISGTGQIRVRKVDQEKLRTYRACANADWPHVEGSEEVARLLPTSTIWPHLLLLRLRTESGKITVLPILPDCVPRDSFRALAVACRWILAQPKPEDRQDIWKIPGID